MAPEPSTSNPWKRRRTRQVYEDHWIRLDVDDVIQPDGKPGTHSVLRLRGGIAVIALDKSGRICIVGQFRYAPDCYSWELPKGSLSSFDRKNIPIEDAKRELEEETGLCALSWKPLGIIRTLIGYSNDIVHMFLATDLQAGQAQPEPTEQLQVRLVSFQEFMTMVENEEITDAPSITTVLLAKERGLLQS